MHSAEQPSTNRFRVFFEKHLIFLFKSAIITLEISFRNSGGDTVKKRYLALLSAAVLTGCLLSPVCPAASAAGATILVTNSTELQNALKSVRAGDEIILREGIYQPDPSSGTWKAFQATADGTADNRIIIRSEDPDHPASICGNSTQSKCALYITGSYWEIRNLKISTACKGIFLAKSEHSIISDCEVFNIGDEAIHIIDNSSYNLVENCSVHDTGLLTPKYGEGVYIGSAKNATDYGFDCHYNTVRSCKFGPNITADHVDIKEYTLGNLVEYCTFDGTGMLGENGGDSFVEIKGNNAIVRYNTGYRNHCEKQLYGFDMNVQIEGWGQNNKIYDNTLFLDSEECYIAKGWKCYTEVFRNHSEPVGCTYNGNRVLQVEHYRMSGDVNEDGQIDSTDLRFLQDSLMAQSVPHISGENADMNQDSVLNAADLTILKRKMLLHQTENKPEILVSFIKEEAGKWRMTDGLGEKTVTFRISADAGSVLNLGWGYWDPYTVNEATGKEGKWIQKSLGEYTSDRDGITEISVSLPADATRVALEVYNYQDQNGKRDINDVVLSQVRAD